MQHEFSLLNRLPFSATIGHTIATAYKMVTTTTYDMLASNQDKALELSDVRTSLTVVHLQKNLETHATL